MTTPWETLAGAITRLSERVDALPSIREATVTGSGVVRFDTDLTDTTVHGSLVGSLPNGSRVLTLKLRHYVWVLGAKGGTQGFASAAERNLAFPNPQTGDTVYRTDRLWWETYYDATKVHVAGWYPTSGRLPEITLKKNSASVSFSGGAWTPVRENWLWEAPQLINTADWLAWDTGCIKTLAFGDFEFEYAMDMNLTAGTLFTISESTGAHAFADDRAIASQAFPGQSGRTTCIVTVRKVTGAQRFVQGNVFPAAAGTIDPARASTSWIKARYVGPPFI